MTTPTSLAKVLPAVRFACDGYVQLVRERPLVEAVASSLTELFFSPDIVARRSVAWESHDPWVDGETFAYFRGRVTRAKALLDAVERPYPA